MFRLVTFLLFGFYLNFLLAYPDGAPDIACGNLYPVGHNVPFQSGSGSYYITVPPTVNSVESGSSFPIKVTSIVSNSSLTNSLTARSFRGFMLSAFSPVSVTNQTLLPAGSFTITDTVYSQPMCVNNGGASITHTLNAGIMIQTISAVYNPPSSPGFGLISFNATVVYDLVTFYALSPVVLSEVKDKVPSTPTLALYDGFNKSITCLISFPPQGSSAIDYFSVELLVNNQYIQIYKGLDPPLPTPSLDLSQYLPTDQTNITLRSFAHNQVGASPYSSPLNFLVPSPRSPVPPSPRALTSTNVKQTSFDLLWTPVPDSHGLTIMYYVLEQQVNNTWVVICAHCSSPYYNVSSARISTTYSYRVSSVTLAGRSLPAYGSATTLGCINNCNGNGVCNELGICVCNEGYLRNDCAVPSPMPLSCVSSHFCVQWAISDDTTELYMRVVSLGTTGWFALGLGAFDGMSGMSVTRFIIGPPLNSLLPSPPMVIYVAELHASGFTTPIPDVQQDIQTDSIAGFVNSTHADVRYTRKFISLDPLDMKLSPIPGIIVPGSFAYGPDAFYQHAADACGRFQIDFGGFTANSLPPLAIMKFYYPVIGALLAIGFFSLLFHLPVFRKSFLVTSRVSFTWPEPHWLIDTLTLGIRQAIMDLTIVEGIVLIGYGGILTSVIYLGRNAFIDYGKDRDYVLGHLSAVHLAIGLLPVTRNSLLALWMASSFERLVKYHRFIMRAALVFLWLHLFAMLRVFGNDKYLENVTLPNGDSALSGFISFVFINAIFLFSLEPVRRYLFDFFYITHLLLFPVAIAMAMLHSIYFRYYVIAPLCLYGLDRLIRFYNSQLRNSRVLNIQTLSTGTKGKELSVLQIHLGDNKFAYEATQYVFINIPSISLTEWHPFSISSAPTKKGLPFTVHALSMGQGTWTHALTQLSHRVTKSSGSVNTKYTEPLLTSYHSSTVLLEGKPLTIKVDGPHGLPSVAFNDYKVLVLVAGGVGITPIMSLALDIYNHKFNKIDETDNRYSNIRDVHLIWTVRHTDSLRYWFPSELALFTSSQSHFHVHLYVTNSDIDRIADEEAGYAYKFLKSSSIQEPGNVSMKDTADRLHAVENADNNDMAVFMNEEQVAQANNDIKSNSNNALAVIHSSISNGRPDFNVLFDKVRREYGSDNKKDKDNLVSGSDIAVYACGPDAMISAVHEAALLKGMALAKETFLL